MGTVAQWVENKDPGVRMFGFNPASSGLFGILSVPKHLFKVMIIFKKLAVILVLRRWRRWKDTWGFLLGTVVESISLRCTRRSCLKLKVERNKERCFTSTFVLHIYTYTYTHAHTWVHIHI